MQFIRKSY
ncbi:hypothetical protein F383_38639 [Gossypium arboreum]|uniref:Uncharacterized protein n=1 Tax=Gossypium arboreum TaxID=29729 RepID=A0A0B0MJX4_GOSAR|nr:hypothetical protein F383_38639 [Gossypium arboreum]